MNGKERALISLAIDKILADGESEEFDAGITILCKLAKRRIKPIVSGTAVPLIETLNKKRRSFVGAVKS